jgi:hypothetical protein
MTLLKPVFLSQMTTPPSVSPFLCLEDDKVEDSEVAFWRGKNGKGNPPGVARMFSTNGVFEPNFSVSDDESSSAVVNLPSIQGGLLRFFCFK